MDRLLPPEDDPVGPEFDLEGFEKALHEAIYKGFIGRTNSERILLLAQTAGSPLANLDTELKRQLHTHMTRGTDKPIIPALRLPSDFEDSADVMIVGHQTGYMFSPATVELKTPKLVTVRRRDVEELIDVRAIYPGLILKTDFDDFRRYQHGGRGPNSLKAFLALSGFLGDPGDMPVIDRVRHLLAKKH